MTMEVASFGEPIDVDNPHFETTNPPDIVTNLGPSIDIDNPLSMAQTPSTEVIIIGEPLPADAEP